MSLESIHLRKLLKILYLQDGPLTAALRADIRDDLKRERGETSDGGDFYSPFWRDAKDHVFGTTDLHETTAARIDQNAGRANLYPQLRDGFLLWWNERRRFTNEPFRRAEALKTIYSVPRTAMVVKISSILAIRDSADADHFAYPYWFPQPALSDEASRLGLWLLSHALPGVVTTELRMLDVIRGVTFSIDRLPMRGNEEEIFRRRYATALRQWQELRREYD